MGDTHWCGGAVVLLAARPAGELSGHSAGPRLCSGAAHWWMEGTGMVGPVRRPREANESTQSTNMPHSLSTESGGGGAPHHDRRVSCRATPASQSRGPVECPESSPAGLAASSQQRSRATAPVSIAHHRHHHRSLARVIARSKEPPAEPGRQSAVARRAPQPHPGGCWLVRGQRRTRGHTHSHSHSHHTTVRAAPAASGGLPAPGRTRRGAEPLYSPLHASKRESEPMAVLLILLVIVTTPHRYELVNSCLPQIPSVTF